MIFKKMNLHNFRQFKGDNELIFSTDTIKNVTIIKGRNTAGKTTLLQAFNWCLYNQLKLENPTEIITNEVISKLNIGESAYVQVCLEFEHANQTYTCKNRIDYVRNNMGNIQKIDTVQNFTVTDSETGETKRTTSNAIREIFPKDLSTYFLFDGERMQEVADNSRYGKKDLSNAVKNLLGLDVLEQTSKDLIKVKKEFETEFKSDNSSRLEAINSELKQLDEDLAKETNNRTKYNEELDELERKFDAANKRLLATASLEELQKKRNEYNKRLEILNMDIETKKNDIFKGFGNCAMNFFLGSTFDKVFEKIKGANLSNKAIDGINANAIDEIFKRGECICGRKLDEDEKAKEELTALRKLLPPENYSILLKEVEMDINHTEENNEAYYNNFQKYYNDYCNLINQKDLLINKINDNEKAIAETGDQDLAPLKEEYNALKNRRDLKHQSIGSCNTEIRIIQDEIRKRENERSQLTVSNDFNDAVMFKVDVCQRLIEKVSNRLIEKETEVKNDLQEKTSELLSKMLNSNKLITIGDDYNFSVTDEFNTTAMSEGEKIVVSFAFVGSIISIAKNFITKDKDAVSEGVGDNKFTLVMDAPFAKLDEQHSENVTSSIPELTDQIILFTVDKQWNGTVEKTLSDKVGIMYEIEKLDSSSRVNLVSKEV